MGGSARAETQAEALATSEAELIDAELKFHPFADLFPLLEGERFDALVDSIKRNGLRDPIVVHEGQILDGRNRLRACEAAEVKVKTVKFKGGDPLEFVIDQNLHRRDLNESQRAMLAVTIATMKVGRPSENAPSGAISQPEAARMVGVSRRIVQRAVFVCNSEKTIPELAERVRRGELAVDLVEKAAKVIPRDEQGQFVNADEPTLRGAAKKYKRDKRAHEMAEKTVAANEQREKSDQLFNVIYADPNWKFQTRSENGMDRSADNHYECANIDELKAMKVPAADDAVLFMWATAPLLPEALELMKAWGFTYRSNQIWAKPHAGTGYWFRSQHEQLLVGTRGNIPAPAPGTQYSSLIEAPLGEHSVKPEAFIEMIEDMFQGLPSVELFARRTRLGWTSIGNELIEPEDEDEDEDEDEKEEVA
jgi:N6-adenosine-specific RNA methylase IME4